MYTHVHLACQCCCFSKNDWMGVPSFVQALIGVATDITELKGLVRALRHSEARYRALFDAAGVGTLMVNLKTLTVTECSKGTCHMLGYEEAEIVGRQFCGFIAPEDEEAALCSFDAFLKGNRSERFKLELQCCRKDGTKIWTRITVTVCENEDLPG
jgi:PAS domain S-box-containing protein